MKSYSPRQAIDSGGYAVVADPFRGEPLSVKIGISERVSGFGRTLSYSQHRFLVVLAEWPDGRRVCKVVEIPEVRVSKEVTVELP